MNQTSEPLAAQARTLAKQGDWEGARTKLLQLVSEVIGASAKDLEINRDQYSLNSLNGLTELDDGRRFSSNIIMRKAKTKPSKNTTTQNCFERLAIASTYRCTRVVNQVARFFFMPSVKTFASLMLAALLRKQATGRTWRQW